MYTINLEAGAKISVIVVLSAYCHNCTEFPKPSLQVGYLTPEESPTDSIENW